MISRMAATVSRTASPPFSAWALASLAIRAVSLACWALRPTEASTDLQAAGDFLKRGRLLGEPCASCSALELSSLLAVETDEVIVRIWLITSREAVDDRVDQARQVAQLVAPVDVRPVVQMALVQAFGDVVDLEQRADEPAAEEEPSTTVRTNETPRMARVRNWLS